MQPVFCFCGFGEFSHPGDKRIASAINIAKLLFFFVSKKEAQQNHHIMRETK
jgi:hypothetical protein